MPSCILLLLFIPRESASHNHHDVLVYFYEVSPLLIGAVFNLLFDDNFPGATCVFGFSISQEDFILTTIETHNHFEDL